VKNTIRLGEWFYARNRVPGCLAAPFLGDRRVGFMHAHKGGAPVLREEASWRTINGIYVNHPWGFFTLCFRRHWK
jgi:hypothetical protein